MSKSIYDRATSYTNDIEWWCDKACDWLGQNISERNEDYDIDNKIDEIRKALEQAQKQEKLLEELKVIFNRHSLRLDRMREWFNLQILESKVLDDIEKLIKEIENERNIFSSI